jgi:hypothetical protein
MYNNGISKRQSLKKDLAGFQRCFWRLFRPFAGHTLLSRQEWAEEPPETDRKDANLSSEFVSWALQ